MLLCMGLISLEVGVGGVVLGEISPWVGMRWVDTLFDDVDVDDPQRCVMRAWDPRGVRRARSGCSMDDALMITRQQRRRCT